MKASNDTVSLTTVRRCGTVVGKEPRNSIAASGYRIRQSRGFFVPVRFHGGRVTDTRPRKGKKSACLVAGFEPPAFYGCDASKRLPVVILINQETFS
ncbi:hypothetical protein LOK85_12620 [Xylella fastidiosa subsp. multiplex]|uniref:hypothetical protein n=1 Tax=Xylella fastidiosa TaxID=2371 RepID=UPI00234D4098|nr:hypothetical protein [Xylella fastidiosa]MDC6416715.1 hypothetical protein [Xylella fastidiosa subsp. multiplex]